MHRLIQIFKNIRKQQYLSISYKGKYAFVGIGNHSINNLYPILNYLRLTLKYIVVKSLKNAKTIDANFPQTIGTIDFDVILKDPEITGIFISSQPESHFGLIKKSLQNNKNVFVEKPPCSNKEELLQLIDIEKNSTGFCMVGMQKRYSPAVCILKKKLNGKIISYNYRFLTGPYPEGNKMLDLFIHPLDMIVYLFGAFTIASIQKTKNSIFIHLLHNDFVGNIELSTEYSWNNAEENLMVNTKDGIYKMKNLDTLFFEHKSGSFFSIPLEKILPVTEKTTVLLNRNKFNPVMENNQLFTAGYYTEIKNFINLSEKSKAQNLSPLNELLLTYDLLDKM